MFTPFVLPLAAGVGLRLALSWILQARFDLDLVIPNALAGAFLLLALLLSWSQTVAFVVPLGLVLPDLLMMRRSI